MSDSNSIVNENNLENDLIGLNLRDFCHSSRLGMGVVGSNSAGSVGTSNELNDSSPSKTSSSQDYSSPQQISSKSLHRMQDLDHQHHQQQQQKFHNNHNNPYQQHHHLQQEEQIESGGAAGFSGGSGGGGVNSDGGSGGGGGSDKSITKLFVGNLPTSTTLPELLAVFKKYGPVNEALSVVKDHNYAFIHFYRREDAEIALREVNDSLFKDRYIRVQFSTSKGFTSKPKRNFMNDILFKITYAVINSN